MDPTLNQFISDAKDIVDRLYADLQQLRSLRAQGRHRRELASRIFRHVHTLKGSAASVGLNDVSQISHEFESVLDAVRLGRVAIDDAVLNLFEDTADAIAESIANSGRGDDSASQALIARLHAVSSAASQQGTIAGSLRSALPDDVSRSLSEYDLQHTREAVREGAKLFVVNAGFPIESFDTQFRELTKLLGQTGEVISTIPGAASTPEEINFRLLYAAELISDHTRSRAAKLGTFECKEIPIAAPDAVGNVAAAVNVLPSPAVPSATSVRVGLNDLDELTSAVTDLLRDTTNALSALQNTSGAGATSSTASDLRSRFVHLEERLIKLRLVPLSDLLNGVAARAGRVAARQLGRDIEFEIIGGNVGIDKSLADLVAEPLMHLVRNAVSHGIETPEERRATGKPPNGSVKLHGFSEGSRIYIVVSDDGRGIDFEQVAEAATLQGIVSRPEDLTSDQALRLIFRPGFSTSPEPSDLSGRGVGLEIVDRAMTQAGGEVRLTSEPGKGATFAMMIPATLALVPCLVVRSDRQFYCFDSSIVADRVNLSDGELSPDAQEADWQGEKLQLLRLNKLLTDANGAADSPRAMLVCKPSEHRQALAAHQNHVALAVDAIAGQQETLVRSLGPHSSLWHGISGAAEMLDGSVALMIDLARLIEANES